VVNWSVLHGDCREQLRALADASVDGVVCDPPYELGFMGKAWDSTGIAYDPAVWQECYRVLKPGGHLIAFGGSRTYHRLACAVEDAGFQIRDQVLWLYGSGFPKSLDVSKAIDKAAGAEREVVGLSQKQRTSTPGAYNFGGRDIVNGSSRMGEAFALTAPATDAARQWAGWGTALKPAHEPAVLARKPLIGTVAENALAHGTGGINVDGCRVGTETITTRGHKPADSFAGGCPADATGSHKWNGNDGHTKTGRWPANLIHDGSEAVVGVFPDTGKSTGGRTVKRSGGGNVGSGKSSEVEWSSDDPGYGDSGSAARFFYCAKASRADRDYGLTDDTPEVSAAERVGRVEGSAGMNSPRAGAGRTAAGRNHHPTVKPIALMRHLVRLVTPPGGLVLDPFTGSGSTGVAAILEGFRFVGCEMQADYHAMACRRIAYAANEAAHAPADPAQPTLWDMEDTHHDDHAAGH
jgi:site-specific DNA-methyltransferase (adenine-specific)